MSDELDAIGPEEQQTQIEAASGAVHFWRDKRLAPFSFGRQATLERLRLRYESLIETAAAIVYLCLLDGDAGIERMERARGPVEVKALRKEIHDWAEREGIGMQNETGIQCADLAEKIWEEIKVSRFVPEAKKDDKPIPNA